MLVLFCGELLKYRSCLTLFTNTLDLRLSVKIRTILKGEEMHQNNKIRWTENQVRMLSEGIVKKQHSNPMVHEMYYMTIE